MQTTHTGTSEVAIFSRILEPDKPNWSVSAARALFALSFSKADKDRMRDLSAKAQEGNLASGEQAEINNHERAGHILSLMKSKARRSLMSRGDFGGKAKTR
jgi:hypothetical protein